jgi:hypothetical protein
VAVVHLGEPAYRAACGWRIAAANMSEDPRATTCQRCITTLKYTHALEHARVVEALAYPKEDHPCLNPPSAT